MKLYLIAIAVALLGLLAAGEVQANDCCGSRAATHSQ
jgi:hypothetical protein